MIPFPIQNIPMSANDLIIIEQIFTQRKAALAPAATDAAFWEFFTAEQILRDYSFDPDDIESGIVGQEYNKKMSGTDGGIDSVYLVANGKLIRDIEQAKALAEHKGRIQLDVIIIQSKKEKGFDIATLIRLNNTSESIFDIGKQTKDFSETYNAPLLDVINRFREAHTATLPLEVKISFRYFIACSGDVSKIDGNIKGKAKELEDKAKKTLSTIDDCRVTFLGARDLISIYRQPKKSTFVLKCLDSINDSKGGYVAIVRLDDFFSMIAEDGQIREHLFESNVRDYEGDVVVNKQIRETLQHPNKDIDFWWLNNGITIIAQEIKGDSKQLALFDPQIVNGLQTSQVVFDCLSNPPLSTHPPRHIVIRIIASKNAEIQDKIVRATNSQTKIPAQYLWASSSRQRDIEETFRANGFHYDRRKNSWRKSGKALESIVGPTELAQSVASIILKEPDHARARPSRYSKPPFQKKIFGGGIALRSYIVCFLLKRRAESFLKTAEPDRTHRNNLIFYVIMALQPLLKDAEGKLMRLQDVDVGSLSNDLFKSALEIVRPIYEKYGGDDKAAKGTEMVRELRQAQPTSKPSLKKK
jgi:hypothetical protein